MTTQLDYLTLPYPPGAFILCSQGHVTAGPEHKQVPMNCNIQKMLLVLIKGTEDNQGHSLIFLPCLLKLHPGVRLLTMPGGHNTLYSQLCK